jgi:hypothetical protein
MPNSKVLRPTARKSNNRQRPASGSRRPKVTPAVHAWLAHNGRLGGIATNNKRAKEPQAA